MSQTLRVLIAEDNPQDAKLVVRELKQAGFEPVWVRVDSEAEFIKELPNNWDIILSDYMMPEFGGPRALVLLQESGLEIPFIIISGTIGEDEAVAAMKLGASDYLLKDRLGRLGVAIAHALEQGKLRRERKDADVALRESEERFREVVQNIEEVFWMTNIEKNRMLFISGAYERIWGRSCESLYQNPLSWLDAIHPEDRERVRHSASTRQAENSYTEEYRVIRPDGTVRWVSDRAFPVRNTAGVVYRIAGVAVDITERKQVEADLRKSEDHLRQSQKMEAIGQLAGGVAHDFNNQLSIILGYAKILSEKIEQSQLRGFANNICTAAQRSADLTQKLLVFARKGQMKTEPVDLHSVLAETIEMLERAVDKRITLAQTLNAESAVIIGNASQLQNALLNLGINARDAMPNGGNLTYSTENVLLDEAFCSKQSFGIIPGKYLKVT